MSLLAKKRRTSSGEKMTPIDILSDFLDAHTMGDEDMTPIDFFNGVRRHAHRPLFAIDNWAVHVCTRSVAAMPLAVAAVLCAIAIVQSYRHGNPAMQSWGYYTAQALAAAFTVGATAMLAIGVREEKGALAGAAAGPAAMALVCWWQAIRKKQAVLASTAEQRIAEQKAEALRIANPLSFVATALLTALAGVARSLAPG